jgi:hypothetical protein
MVLFLIIIAVFLITYTVTGAVIVSKGNIPSWAKTVFTPYVKFAKSANISFLPFEEKTIENTQPSRDKIIIFNPVDVVPTNIPPPLPETKIDISPGPKVLSNKKVNKACLMPIVSYKNNVDLLNNISFPSIDIDQNSKTITNLCKIGKDIITKDCTSLFFNPIRDKSFVDLCCNGKDEYDSCTDESVKCTLDKSKFYNKAYNLTNFNDSALINQDNKDVLSEFCNLGSDIMSSKCNNDKYYPMNNDVFKKYCCNGSSDEKDCGIDSFNCSIKSADFMNKDYSTQNIQLSSVEYNKDIIKDYCDIGIDVLNKKCILTDPLKSKNFNDICCNGSDKAEDCNVENMSCIFDTSDFYNSDYSLQNMELSAVRSNKDTIIDYCDSGINLLTKKCTQLNPVNSDKFRSFCCNNSTHPEECNIQSTECLFNSGDFATADYDLQNMTLAAAKVNKDKIIDYCQLGDKINNNSCSQIKPVNSEKYRFFCCNNSTDQKDCNENNLNCTFDSSEFTTLDYNLQNMELSAIKSNREAITEYCTLGNKLLLNNCNGINPINSDKFRQLCCNNSVNPTECSLKSMECIFESGDFTNKNYDVQNMELSAVNSNRDTIIDYCTTGIDLYNEKCSQVIPSNSDKFRSFCCNNSSNTDDCTIHSVGCLFESGDFTTADYDLQNMTLSAAKVNKDKIIDYCKLGEKINTNMCTQVIPVNSEKYRSFCCNNSTHSEDCNENNLNCTFNSSEFIENDYNLQNMELSAVKTNKDTITNYCNIGIDLLAKKCTQTNPVNSDKFKNMCCNNSTHPEDCNEKSTECLFDSGDFNTDDNNMKSVELSSVKVNKDKIIDYCKLGEKINTNGCKQIIPVNSEKYRSFCCNNSTHPEDCNENSTECLFNSGDFSTLNYDLQNMELSSVKDNKDKIINYCDIGIDLLDKKCTQTNPVNSDKFRSFCCNNSTYPEECNIQSTECLFNSGDFATADYDLQNITLNSVKENKNTIMDYCKLGTNLLDKKCKQIDPVNSDKFKNMCCNNSTHPEDCNEKSIECIFDSSDFTTADYDLQNMTLAATKVNKEKIIDYCKLGEKLNNNSCTQISPINSEKYRSFCCNNSTNTGDCNENNLNCTFDSSDFIEKDYNLQNMDMSAIKANKNIITEYCTLGNKLLSNNCNVVNPLNSDKFRQLCCDNSTTSSDCNTKSLECLFNSSDFVNEDYNISNMTLSSVNDNKDTINSYCDLGENIIGNNCSTHPVNYTKFKSFCCNNSTHPDDCIIKSRECLFDSGLFETMANNMSNITLSSVEPNRIKLQELCDLGKKLQTNSCTQTNPMNNDVYRNFCCNGSTDPNKCTPESLQCTFDSSGFSIENYNNENMTLFSIYGNNENTIKDYCSSGQTVIKNNCNGIIPTNSIQFRNFCCNTETDCSDKSLQCTLDSSGFLNKDYSMSNMEIMAVDINKDKVIDYCLSGDKVIENNCKLTYPTTSDKFRQLCCNNSTNPDDCNQKSLNCTLKSSVFANNDYNMTNINLLSNTGTVSNYCSLGIDVLNNKCNTIQPLTPNFIKLCCNGVANNNNCSMSSLQCLINSNKIYNKVSGFQTLNYPTNIDTINSSNGVQLSGASSQIEEYCSLLQDINNIPGCTYNNDYANKYSSLCPVIECIPNFVNFQQRIDNLSTNTTDNKILNADPICTIGNNIISTCPLLTDKVKNYNGFYNTFCPQPTGCGTIIGNTYSQIKYGYKQQPNVNTAQSVCDWGNNSIKTCGDGSLNSTGWYINYVVNDGIYTPNCKPVDCVVSAWNPLSPCDCGVPGNLSGTQSHTRTITTNQQNYGSKSCPPLTETLPCTDCTPLDCQVSAWSNWSSCSATGCSNGIQTRTRNVTRQAYNGGAVCPSLIETAPCTGPCNCVVSDWNQWSTCPVDNCYNDPPVSTRNRTILSQPSGGGTVCPYLSESHVCQSSCPYRIYQNTQMYKSPSQGSSWFASVPNDVECAKKCANQAGCQSASVNGYWYGTWRCDMYNFKNNQYPYSGGFHMVYPWKTPVPLNTNGLPSSRNDLIGQWKDIYNQVITTSLDPNNSTQILVLFNSNNTTAKLSVDVTNKAIYYLLYGSVAYMKDINTIMFSDNNIWTRVLV